MCAKGPLWLGTATATGEIGVSVRIGIRLDARRLLRFLRARGSVCQRRRLICEYLDVRWRRAEESCWAEGPRHGGQAALHINLRQQRVPRAATPRGSG